MDLEAKKQVLRRLGGGIFAVGVRDAGADRGGRLTTVSWAMQLSVEPPLVGVALEVESRTLGLVRAAGGFTLAVLAADGAGVAAKLGRASIDVPNKDAGVAWVASPTLAAPIPAAASGWVECRVAGDVTTGDHALVIGSVIAAGISGDAPPLTLAATGWIYGG